MKTTNKTLTDLPKDTLINDIGEKLTELKDKAAFSIVCKYTYQFFKPLLSQIHEFRDAFAKGNVNKCAMLAKENHLLLDELNACQYSLKSDYDFSSIVTAISNNKESNIQKALDNFKKRDR